MFKKMIIVFLFITPLSAWSTKYSMPSPGNDLIGELISVRAEPGETINIIGDRYGIGLHEMLEANPTLNQDELSGGESVLVPTQFVLPKYRKGIIINLAECRLYYFTPDGQSVYTYPVGLGRKGWRTPTTSTTVIRKAANPNWTVPSSIHKYVYEQTGNWLPDVVHPGPDNPLGPYALYLGTHGYLIHGTNQPWSIGKLISAGCIRLFNSDVSELYPQIKTGTPVKVIHQPYKAGWQDGKLYLEAHVPLNLNEPPSELNVISHEKALLATKVKRDLINWEHVQRIVEQKNGVPELVNNHQYTYQEQDEMMY